MSRPSDKLYADPRLGVKVLYKVLRKERVSPKLARAALADLFLESDPTHSLPVHTERDVLLAFAELSDEMEWTPAIHEVATRVGLANSTTSVKMAKLELKGYFGRVIKAAQCARNYTLTDKAHTYIKENA